MGGGGEGRGFITVRKWMKDQIIIIIIIYLFIYLFIFFFWGGGGGGLRTVSDICRLQTADCAQSTIAFLAVYRAK